MFRNLKVAFCLIACFSVLSACGPSNGGGAKTEKGADASTGTATATVTTADDSKLQTDVEAKLKAEPSLKDVKIEVKVAGGQITLSGTVKKPEEKDKAEEIVNGVIGTTKAGLVNDIQIAE